MRKLLSFIIAAALLFTLTSCMSDIPDNVSTDTVSGSDSGRSGYSVITTIFPIYDWVRNITDGSGSFTADYLIDNGADIHGYQPTADDIIQISNSDLFIYNGGVSDIWVEDTSVTSSGKDTVYLNMMECLGNMAKEEEIVEGMETGTYEHSYNVTGTDYDEHIWLSLKNVEVLVGKICDAVCAIDPDNAGLYRENTEKYIDRLDELDREYDETVGSSASKTLLFADRFPFRYMTDDYGLSYYAAFLGCSAENEVSFSTISFLAGKVDELGLHYVIRIDGSDGSIADTVVNNTKTRNQEILVLDSMQNVVSREMSDDVTYLSVMEKNLEALRKALN